jgi:hypothetical protein
MPLIALQKLSLREGNLDVTNKLLAVPVVDGVPLLKSDLYMRVALCLH